MQLSSSSPLSFLKGGRIVSVMHGYWILIFSVSTVLGFGRALEENHLLSLDPKKSIHQYVYRIWGENEGLPQNAVHSIVQTRDDYLWLATQGGLVRFDGASFTVFDPENTPSIQNNYINILYEDRSGNLWIGTRGGGLNRYKDGKFVLYTIDDGLAGNDVRAICEDRAGNLWIGTSRGLSQFKNEGFTSHTGTEGLDGNDVRAICEDHAGNLWIGTWNDGLIRLRGEKSTLYTTKNGLLSNFVWSLHEDRDGNLWIGAWGGLTRLKDGKFTNYTTIDGLAHNTVPSVHQDRAGSLWIGSYGNGLTRLINGVMTTFTPKDGLPDHRVLSFCEDVEGNLWVGTGGGLVRFRDGSFTSFTASEGLSFNDVRAIYEDRKRNLWIGTDGGGLNLLKNGEVIVYDTKRGLSSNDVNSLYEDRAGNLWVGTWEGGLNRLKDGKITVFDEKDGLASNYITSVYEDQVGNLWIGTLYSGLNLFKDGNFLLYTTEDGLSSNSVQAIHEDRAGNLWIATEGGLSHFKDGKFTTYTTNEGLSSNIVRALYEDQEGRLWLGTEGGGLCRFRQGNFEVFRMADGLLSDNVWHIMEDDRGNFWMSSYKGIYSVRKKDLEDFSLGKINWIESVVYGTDDGMKTAECSYYGHPAGFKTRDGKLWFPTMKGAVMVDPEYIMINKRPPSVVIEQLIIDQKPIAFSANIQVPAGKHNFEFHYTGLSFLNPKKVQFKYQLEGYDQGWVDAGSRRVAYYTNLTPKYYRFRVIASNNDGVWNEAGSAISFTLSPQFYETGWFKALGALFFGLILYAGLRLRTRNIEKHNEELERRIRERTIELEATNKELQAFSYSVSHDLRAPLRGMDGLSQALLDDYSSKLDKQGKDYLSRVRAASQRMGELIDDLLSLSRVSRGELDRQKVDLGKMTESIMSQLQQTNPDHKVEFTCRGRLKVIGDKRLLRIVLENLLGNAWKFTGKQPVASVKLGVDDENGSKVYFVKDNGVGFDMEYADKLFSPFQRLHRVEDFEGTGIGLATVQRIIQRHGGEVWAVGEVDKGATFYFTLL